MDAEELLKRAAACLTCNKEHKHRRIGMNQGTWAAEDGHHYRPTIDIGTVAKLRYIATGVYTDPWALPEKSGLAKAMARVVG